MLIHIHILSSCFFVVGCGVGMVDNSGLYVHTLLGYGLFSTLSEHAPEVEKKNA